MLACTTARMYTAAPAYTATAACDAAPVYTTSARVHYSAGVHHSEYAKPQQPCAALRLCTPKCLRAPQR
eukprot:3867729-Pyramimonas_sp.AAC.1